MKHGDKAKATSAKAVSKTASGKGGEAVKSSKAGAGEKAVEAGAKSSSKVPQSKKQQAGEAPKAGAEKAGAKVSASSKAGEGNGKSKARPQPDESGFTNPAVGAAFKRAIKKYPNAFRRLTD